MEACEMSHIDEADERHLMGSTQWRSPLYGSSSQSLRDGSSMPLFSVIEESEEGEEETEEDSILFCRSPAIVPSPQPFSIREVGPKPGDSTTFTQTKLPPIAMKAMPVLSVKHDVDFSHCSVPNQISKDNSTAGNISEERVGSDTSSVGVIEDYGEPRELTEKDLKCRELEASLLRDSKGNLFEPIQMSLAGRYQPLEENCEAFRLITFGELRTIHDSSGRIGSSTGVDSVKKANIARKMSGHSQSKLEDISSKTKLQPVKMPSCVSRTFLADTITKDRASVVESTNNSLSLEKSSTFESQTKDSDENEPSIPPSKTGFFRRFSVAGSVLSKIPSIITGTSGEPSVNIDSCSEVAKEVVQKDRPINQIGTVSDAPDARFSLAGPKSAIQRFSVTGSILPKQRSLSCGPAIISGSKPGSGTSRSEEPDSIAEEEPPSKIETRTILSDGKETNRPAVDGTNQPMLVAESSNKVTVNAVVRMKAWKTKMGKEGAGGRKSVAQDDLHYLALRKHAEEVSVQLPMPMKLAIFEECYPVIQSTVKLYQRSLGKNHPLTKEAVEQLQHYEKIHSLYQTL